MTEPDNNMASDHESGNKGTHVVYSWPELPLTEESYIID